MTPRLRVESPLNSPGHVPSIDAAMGPTCKPIWNRAITNIAIWLFLISLAWLAHFSLSLNIGFYSDDQTFAVAPLSWSSADLGRWLSTQAISYPEPQGRPLGFILGIGLAYLGDHLAGVDGMFLIGWWILSLNAILFYHLLNRCFARPLALLGSLGYVLFPADTTRPFLCHAHILQPSLTFFLIAAHLFIGGGNFRRSFSYACIVLCLITYESAMLPFVMIPLLEPNRDNGWRKRFAIHLLILFCIVAFVGLTRKLGHEYRADQANGSKSAIFLQIAVGTIIGPAAAVAAFGWRAITASIQLWRGPSAGWIFAAAVALFWLMLRSCGRVESSLTRGELRRAIEFGVPALGVSYLLSFTHFPPAYLEGQNTSVHLAAVIGASVLFAAMCLLIQNRFGKTAATTAIAIYLALLLINSMFEQEGFVTLWQERQQFWTHLLDICPDLKDGTLVVCDNQLPQPTNYMPASCWSDSAVLQQVYRFPSEFAQAPQVSCFPPDDCGRGWRTWLARNPAGNVVWTQSPYGRKIGDQLIEGNTILLHMDANGKITRIDGTVNIAGQPFRLKPIAPRGKPSFPTLPFYGILVNGAR